MTAAQFIDRLGRRVLWMQGLIGMFIWFSFITALSVSVCCIVGSLFVEALTM
jgi:MFS family permease